MNASHLMQLFGFTFNASADESADALASLRERIYDRVDETYRPMATKDATAAFMQIGEDLVALGDEIRRARLLAEPNTNYVHALGILQDALRHFVHRANGRWAGLKVFLGVRTDEEREVVTARCLTKVVRQENERLVQSIKDLIPEIARRSAAETVESLRNTPQRQRAVVNHS